MFIERFFRICKEFVLYLEEFFVAFVKGSFHIQKKPVLCIE